MQWMKFCLFTCFLVGNMSLEATMWKKNMSWTPKKSGSYPGETGRASYRQKFVDRNDF